MLRRILAVVAGIVAAMAIVFLVQAAGRALFPLPNGMTLDDPDSIRGRLDLIPIGALASLLAAWTAGALGGSYVARQLLGKGQAVWAYIAGAVVLLGAALTTMRIPHPFWFVLVSPILILAATVLGAWPSRERRRKLADTLQQ